MVNKCCAPGCRTGYKALEDHERTDQVAKLEAVSIHKFPPDPSLQQKWIQAIPRKD
ncbi:hypothetical protein TCAL_14044 [Tigriopus californicus]|uniref:THAP-type domain-containing protein n=1 Tax=Tigriopus californicus TaxID=6832 RepID=A0A553P1W4_TIGCA|nr:hypothetical protein TCAL_14044 [Tigriopus californicus]